MATLAEFPDRQLLGEDVIWSGDEEAGYVSSHRIVSTATHHGGTFGPATGRRVTFRTIADTFCRENRVWDEWLTRDNAAYRCATEDMARAWIAAGSKDMLLTPATDLQGPYTGTGNDNEWGTRHASILHRIMAADLSVIPEQYDRACHLSLPGCVDDHGWAAADSFWIGLRSAFPSATFKIDHQIGRTDPLLTSPAAPFAGRLPGATTVSRPHWTTKPVLTYMLWVSVM